MRKNCWELMLLMYSGSYLYFFYTILGTHLGFPDRQKYISSLLYTQDKKVKYEIYIHIVFVCVHVYLRVYACIYTYTYIHVQFYAHTYINNLQKRTSSPEGRKSLLTAETSALSI